MALLNITEFKRMAVDAQGKLMPVGEMPSLAVQSITFTATTNSAVFHTPTKLIRVLADADAFIKVGTGTQAVAAGGGTKLEADVAEYFGINGVKEMQLAVWDGSS